MGNFTALELADAIVKFGRLLIRRSSADGGYGSLHHGQGKVLSMICEHEGLTQCELSRKLSIRPPSLAELLEKMEKSGYIVKYKDRRDARVVRVSASEKGKALIAERRESVARNAEELFSDLTCEEWEQLFALFTRLNAKLEDEGDGGSANE